MTREEAIKELKGFIGHLTEGCQEAIKVLIPQLAESEDERIRKGLIKLLTVASEAYLVESTGIKKDSYLAYLEKQKEVGNRNTLPIEQQMEAAMIAIRGEMPSKSQEWSEEDEEMLNSCISSIEEAKENRYAYKETDGDTSYDHEISWLKSLRPQQKQEWTEDEKQKLNRIYSIIGWAMDEHAFSSCKKLIGDKEGVELQDFLRSIAKPETQPHWKPSEEQISALEKAIIRIHSDDEIPILCELRQQLKKLM